MTRTPVILRVLRTVGLGLAAAFGLALGAYAQPTWTLTPAFQTVAEAAPGQQVCIAVETKAFEEVLYFSTEFVFDSTVLRFDSVTAFGALPDFEVADHVGVPGGPDPGSVRVEWNRFDYVPGERETPTSIPDGTTLFEVCFTAIGAEGTYSDVAVRQRPFDQRNPDPKVVTANSATRSVGLRTRAATVVIGPQPTRLQLVDAIAPATGAEACVDLVALSPVNDLREFEFFIAYRPDKLDYVGVQNLTPGLGATEVSLVEPGLLRITSPPGGIASFTSVAGERLLSLCFEALRECDGETVSEANVFDRGPDFVAQTRESFWYTGVGRNRRALIIDSGQFDVAPCGGEVVLRGEPAVGAQGDRRCVRVVGAGFTEVTSGTFVFDFDETELSVVNVVGAPGLGAGVGYSLSGGRLTVDMNATGGVTVPLAGELFSICVELIGAGPTIVDFVLDKSASTVTKTAPGPVGQGGGIFAVILTGDGARIDMRSAEAPRGDTVCVKLRVSGFNGLSAFRGTLEWDSDVMELESVNPSGALRTYGYNDPDQGFAFFKHTLVTQTEVVNEGGRSLGKFGFNWFANSSLMPDRHDTTLVDGTEIFELCFRIVGEPGECTTVRDALNPASAKSSPDGPKTFETLIDRYSTVGWNEGLLVPEASICSAYDSAWVLRFPTPAPQISPEGDCFEATLERYNRIDSARFSFAFDETKFNFVSIEPIRRLAPVTSVDLSQVGSGLVGVEIEHFRPRTLASPTAAFELCFEAIPGATDCAPLTGADTPVPRFGFANRRERQVRVVDGAMCATSPSPPNPEATITEASCAGEEDGAIALFIAGEASRNFAYSWASADGTNVAGRTTRDLTGLGPGNYTLTITDLDGFNPAIPPFTYTIAPPRPRPVAMLPDSIAAPCDDASAIVVPDNGTDARGGTISWRALDGGSVVGGAETTTPSLSGAGAFEMTVASPGGCVALDSIKVGRPSAAAVSLPTQLELDCNVLSLDLLGSVTGLTDDVTLTWTASAGGVLPTGSPTDTETLTGVTAPGTYTLTSSLGAAACRDDASVEVIVNRPEITVTLPVPDSLNCRNEGRVSVTPEGVTGGSALAYVWTTTDGTIDGASD